MTCSDCNGTGWIETSTAHERDLRPCGCGQPPESLTTGAKPKR